jgi:hypothetical protein
MTNDEIWHQSTVMERCEILRSRLDDMESTVDHTARITQHYRGEQEAEARIERWKRIEAAAMEVVSLIFHDGKVSAGCVPADALREALKR